MRTTVLIDVVITFIIKSHLLL